MTTAATQNWQQEFGLDDQRPPRFFGDKTSIAMSAPQGHLLRRAFDGLKIDGVLCSENSPLIYFKSVEEITPDFAFEMQKKFWNHNGAALLVLISHDCVHIYSGMVRPTPTTPESNKQPSLVEILDRTANTLQSFVVSVESGEFFRKHKRSFDSNQRVDRYLLKNLKETRDKLNSVNRPIPENILDALLCRLVFTCYLFDRGVVGKAYLESLKIQDSKDLRDVLSVKPATKAKDALYEMFNSLQKDFNGDLFGNGLSLEKDIVSNEHISILSDFFHGTDAVTGQMTLFWPYDFKHIPIETISAIYEQFLSSENKEEGAVYTPRFLTEVVLDTALENLGSLVGKRYLDPACGSGIFLVGLFNRIAEEWKQSNPDARDDQKATELMRLLQSSLYGVDINRTACYITAFSLYLAYLDQLTPPDIQALQAKGKALPQLVATDESLENGSERNIYCADFFSDVESFPKNVDLVVGNPPWGSIAKPTTPAGKWCRKRSRPVPGNQIAAAFIWKAAEHIADSGNVCLLLPHGVLFNHSRAAINFQRAWVEAHAFERVLNLADLRYLLFEDAIHPAIVVNYRKYPPKDHKHPIEYWAPKADWTNTQAEVITIAQQDRTTITTGKLLTNLASPDAPQIWKSHYWATPRDQQLLGRLFSLPRLRDIVRRAKGKVSSKRWLITEGFQPVGNSDDPVKAKTIETPNQYFIPASSKAINLFLLPEDCQHQPSTRFLVRSGSNTNIHVFRHPHVLIKKGFGIAKEFGIAFADFDVSFQHAVRGITGPKEDRKLLMFLAAYLRTPLARYFVFHTSSNWGIYRPEVHVDELLRVPFPLPTQQPNPERCQTIVDEVSAKIDAAIKKSTNHPMDRDNQIKSVSIEIEPLIYEYFDILPMEAALINDTMNVIVPSIQPTPSKMPVATLKPTMKKQYDKYLEVVLEKVNSWGKRSGSTVYGKIASSELLGIAVAILQKTSDSHNPFSTHHTDKNLIIVLNKLRSLLARQSATIDIVRGLLVFDGDSLYIIKPIGQRHWTQTAAINDADRVATTILMHSTKGGA
jgi:type I restriction-modification system DNA methylase subunit